MEEADTDSRSLKRLVRVMQENQAVNIMKLAQSAVFEKVNEALQKVSCSVGKTQS